jgi:hypothetical protein
LPNEWYDKHTKEGKEMGRGYAHFFEIMELHPRVYERGIDENGSVIPNACVRGGNDPYESEAKDLYLDFLLDGCEARVRHILDPSSFRKKGKKKRIVEACDEIPQLDTSNKKMKVVEKEVLPLTTTARANNDTSVSTDTTVLDSDVMTDTDVFHVPESTGLIGFKNFTVIGELKRPLPGLALGEGAPVFVKMGESYETCLFAKACDELRGQLGMASMQENMGITWVVPTYNVAELVSRTNPAWVAGATSRMEKAMKSYAVNGALPTIVMDVFEGYDICHKKEWVTDGMELLKVLIFRKFVGSADTNGKNLMVNEHGRILSVDETIASSDQLERYKSKGLVTAQKIHSDLLEKAASALYEHPGEVAKYIRDLMSFELPSVINANNRLVGVHSAIPFDDSTQTILLSSSKESLRSLSRKLKLE